jgi:drug/metabolite transporter (DMT)-like permease
MDERSQRCASVLQLLLASVIWGSAFVALRAGMEHVGPFTFNAGRFLLGSAVLVPLLFVGRRRRNVPEPRSRKSVVWGLTLAGLVLFGAASLQQIGIVHTSAGKAGFITGLYVVIVPLLGLLRRQRAGLAVRAGAALQSAACGVLSLVVALFAEVVSSRISFARGSRFSTPACCRPAPPARCRSSGSGASIRRGRRSSSASRARSPSSADGSF